MKTLIKILCLSVLWFSCEDQNQDIHGCLDSQACNYNPDTTLDNNSCIYLEDKIEQGYCSCDNDVYDDCGVCGGDGVDTDNDGICDDVDDCVGEYDECGDCNGDGVDADNDGICDDVDDCVGEYDCEEICNGDAVIDECGECGGDGIDEGDCDCDGNVLDDCGVCGGEGEDEDEDGICDDVDDCVGEYDCTGECNGDAIEDCGGGCEEYVELWGECYNISATIELNLNYSNLTGEIPSEIENLTNLQRLYLRGNQLTGEIPSEIGNLTNLWFLNLDYNQLSGVIPEEICNQGDSTPSVSHNKLCPPYPSCISQEDIDTQDTSNCP